MIRTIVNGSILVLRSLALENPSLVVDQNIGFLGRSDGLLNKSRSSVCSDKGVTLDPLFNFGVAGASGKNGPDGIGNDDGDVVEVGVLEDDRAGERRALSSGGLYEDLRVGHFGINDGVGSLGRCDLEANL